MSLNVKKLESLAHPVYPLSVYKLEDERVDFSWQSNSSSLTFKKKRALQLVMEEKETFEDQKKKLLFRLNVI